MEPTVIAPPHTMLDWTSVTSVWKREVGRVTRQNLGISACAPEHVASDQETRKWPWPVAPTAPGGSVPEGRFTGPGDAIELSFVQLVFSRPPPDASICTFANPFSVQPVVDVLRISKVA